MKEEALLKKVDMKNNNNISSMLLNQVRELKKEQENIKKLKEIEMQQQRQYIQNCQKVLGLYR
jgi:hypothetical protein